MDVDMTYETGVAVALLINLVKIIMSAAERYSIRSANMALIGNHFSWWTGGHVDGKKTGWFSFLMYLGYMLVLTPAFGWLTVAVAVGTFIWNKARKQEEVPDNIKALRFKIASVRMTKKQVIDTLVEIAKLNGAAYRDISLAIEEWAAGDPSIPIFGMQLNRTEDGHDYVHIDPVHKKLVLNGRFDYTNSFQYEFEYRLAEKSRIEIKAVRQWSKDYTSGEYIPIEDGVVIESVVQRQFENKKSLTGSVERELERLNAAITWREVLDPRVKFLIIANGGVLGEVESRSFLQKEKQRIEKGFKNTLELLVNNGAVISETDGDISLQYKDQGDLENRKTIDEILEKESLARFNITHDEFFKKSMHLKEIDRHLVAIGKAA
jgi:hypothetical protein